MGKAIDALFYLRTMSLKNAVVSRVLRHKQPKYLIGAVIGGAYIFFVLSPGSRGERAGGADAAALTDAFPIERLEVVASLGALALTVFAALYWLLP